jgi:hypothetical protein
MRVLISSSMVIRISTSSPSTRASAQARAMPFTAARELDGMIDRTHWMT